MWPGSTFNRATRAHTKGSIMAIQRQEIATITNTFQITDEDGKRGVQVRQTKTNGRTQAVSILGFTGKNKSAATVLDRHALEDLHVVLMEVLADMDS